MTHALVSIVASGALAPSVEAQERLLNRRNVDAGPMFQTWKFADGLQQPGTTGKRVTGASQLALPLSGLVPINDAWAIDVSTAYAYGKVTFENSELPRETQDFELQGFTDTRLRVVGRIRGDALLLTLGATLPTGTVKLDRDQLQALRVLGAPALRMPVPGLGNGPGGTTGIVATREVGAWAVAGGAAYELRARYAPVAAATAGASDIDFDPGDAIHLTLGADRLIGQNAFTMGVAADLFTTGKVSGGVQSESRLGPVVTTDVQYRMANTRLRRVGLREITVFGAERFRSPFTLNGEKKDGSSGHEGEFGMTTTVPFGRALGLSATGVLAYSSGLSVDNSLTTAAFRSASLQLGLPYRLGGDVVIRPYAGVQAGRIKSGTGVASSVSAGGISAGLTLSTEF